MIGDTVILEVMKYFIVAVGLLMCYAEIRQAVKLRGVSYAWVKWALGVMGLYWAFYYVLSLIGLPLLAGHQVWIRSPLLLTLSLVSAGAILSLRRR